MDEIKYIGNVLGKKWVTSFKQLMNNPKPLTKKKYIESVLPNIDKYYLTDKADGLRSFLLITKNYIKLLTSENVKYLPVENPFEHEYIFDCEYIEPNIFIFDVIKYKDKNVSNEIFQDRYKLLQEFQDMLEKSNLKETIKVKKIYKLAINNYQSVIINVYKYKSKEYTIDGLIFVESTANYNNTINLKWKPAEYLTIDFLAIQTHESEYILLTGIKPSIAKNFGLETNNNYKSISKSLEELDIVVKDEYMPIPFYNSLKPNIYLFSPDSKEDLHGHIVELSLNDDGKWEFHRIRYDRDVELKNGSYYGNDYKTAETTLQSILNPLSIKELISSRNALMSNQYFKKQDDEYRTVKKFNNYVKNLLIQRYKAEGHDSVIDLAAGRGGDLAKYTNAGIKNLLMLEIDINAIDELLDRKYKIFTRDVKCNMVVLRTDLNDDYKKNITSIEKNLINSDKYMHSCLYLAGSVKIMHCHFAMHYLLTSEKAAKNIASFINHFLSKGGVFIMTVFDGRKVFDLLKQNKGKWNPNEHYKISRIGADKNIFSGFDHKIEVLLPLADKPYTEPLVDLIALDKVFKVHKIMRVEEKGFGDILAEYSKNNASMNSKSEDFSDIEKQFINLYKYVIYTKS